MSTTGFNLVLQRIKTLVGTLCWEVALTLRRICFNPQNPDESGTDTWITSIHFPVVVVLASIGVVSCLLTLAASGGWVVVLASMLTLLLSPYLVLQKQVLAVLGDLRRRQRDMKRRINDLRVTNQILNQSIEILEPQAQTLSLVEGDLNQIADEANVDKNHLIRVVEETNRLQKLIQQHVQTRIIQEIMTTVATSGDSNRTFALTVNDVNTLQSRLTGLSQVLHLNDPKFRQLLQDDRGETSLIQVTKLLRNLLDGSLTNEQQVFQVSFRK